MECNKCRKSAHISVIVCTFDTVWCRHNKREVQTTTAYVCKAYEPEEVDNGV